VLCAGNDLQFQFLGEADFRSVVTVNGDALEDFPEIAIKLGIGFRNGVAVARTNHAIAENFIVDGAELNQLLFGRGVSKILAV